MPALRPILVAAGALFALSLVIPWNGPHTAWTILARPLHPLDRVPVLLLVVASLACLSFGMLRVSHGARAITAALVGTAGVAIWFLVDPPRIVTAWASEWRLVVVAGASVLLPAALLAHRPVWVTVGVAALVAVFSIPPEEGPTLIARLAHALANPERFTWPQTATLLWILTLLALALVSLTIWIPRRAAGALPSPSGLSRVLAWIFISWTAILLALSDVIPLAQVGGRVPPIALLAPLHLFAYAALAAHGLAWIARARR